MNKIVHEHVPVSELPEKLRKGISDDVLVTIIVQEEQPVPTREELLRLAHRAQKNAKGVTTEEAVARIRALRDEWDD